MAQVANTFATFNSTRNREQLMNNIWNVSVSDTPFVKLINKEKVDGVFVEWNTDTYRAAAANKVEQGNASTKVARTPSVRLSNRTQISEDVFGITGTQEKVEKAGPGDHAYELAKSMVALKKDIEYGCLQNTTAIAASSGVAPQARGLFGFLDTNVSFGAGVGAKANPVTNTAAVDGTQRALTETLLKTVLQNMFDSGADIDNSYILLPSTQRTVFDTFLAGQTRFDKAEDKSLTATLEVYIGPFGRVKAVNARHMRQREVAIINPEYLALGTLRPMKDTPLAKTGDTEDTLVNTEWTLIVKNTAAHGAILDLS